VGHKGVVLVCAVRIVLAALYQQFTDAILMAFLTQLASIAIRLSPSL
jgi:hypothetical protein